MMTIIAKKEKNKEAIEWVKLNSEKCEKVSGVNLISNQSPSPFHI